MDRLEGVMLRLDTFDPGRSTRHITVADGDHPHITITPCSHERLHIRYEVRKPNGQVVTEHQSIISNVWHFSPQEPNDYYVVVNVWQHSPKEGETC